MNLPPVVQLAVLHVVGRLQNPTLLLDHAGRDQRRGRLRLALAVRVRHGVVGPPLVRLLVADNSESPGTKQERHTHKTYVFPIFPDNDENAVLFRVLVIRVLAGDRARVLYERAERLAGSIAADDEDFTRRAGVDRFLILVRSVEPQSL